MDPDYAGPEFDFDKIIKDLMNKVLSLSTTSWNVLYLSLRLINGFFVSSNSFANQASISPKTKNLFEFSSIKSGIKTIASGYSQKIIYSGDFQHANKHKFYFCQSDAGIDPNSNLKFSYF